MATEGNSQDFTSLKRSRTAQLAQLTKLYNELEKNMLSYDNVDGVKQLYSKLCSRFEQFKNAHLQTLDMCTDTNALENLELTYASCKTNFDEFRERYSEWMSAVVPEDNERFSTVSGSSVSSQARLKIAKAKRLVAENKLKRLQQKHELERARKELELKQQILEQECEIEEARLEESVWDQGSVTGSDQQNSNSGSAGDHSVIDGENNLTSGDARDQCRTTDDKNCASGGALVNSDKAGGMNIHQQSSTVTMGSQKNSQYENVQYGKSTNNIQSGVSELTLSSIDTAFQQLASTLQEGFNLPKPELFTFNGTPTDYCKFIKNFDTNIESRICDNRLRLSYLIQYCTGEAKLCIEDCVLLEPNDGYKRARSILFSRYGRPHVIARSYIEKLVYGPQIKASDVEGISRLALEMQKCEITLSQLGFASDVDNSENLRRIVKRLPMHMRVKWVDIAHSINESGREPRFSDLAKFVDEKSRVASSMYGLDLACEGHKGENQWSKSNQNRSNEQGGKGSKVSTFTTHSETDKAKYEWKCRCCSGSCSELACCTKFKSMSLDDRTKLVRKFRLCYNCLKGKHSYNNCRKSVSCSVSDCKMKHHILLHSWAKPNIDHTATQPQGTSVNCASTNDSAVKNCLGIIPVTVKGENGKSCQTYALLDDGSDKTLCDERLLQTLNVASRPVTFQMSTVSTSGNKLHGQEVDLHVKSLRGNEEISLRNVWSVNKLPISTRSASEQVDLCNLPYLTDIKIPRINASEVMLLIGIDSPDAHIPLEVRSGRSDQPYAIRSRLGWVVRGPMKDTSKVKSHEINVHFQQSNDVLLQQQLERMWTTDFDNQSRTDKNSMSVEDKRALKSMESSITQEDGHYKLGLPWRDAEVTLPNNLPLAHARLHQLKRKLARDTTLHKMYTTTVNDYIQKGYAKEVTNIDSTSKRVWYLPHHPVLNVNKPDKVRGVFDCAAKYEGVSLNSKLLQGPDLMNSLVGVVIRFRQEQVAIAADIEAMFHQVRVLEEDCDALRFLWWPDGDIDKQPKCYCMQVHLFGATSSPSCTSYALRRTASDHTDLFEPEVVSTVKKNFYVDDCLKSVPTEETAIKLASDLQLLMKMGGFRLTKWLSNSKTVLNAIPESERASSVVNLNPDDMLPSDRALGIQWDVHEDEIKFKVKLAVKPHTRRGLVSIVSSIFDPLGLVSPVTLRAKAIVQNLCRCKLGWDDPIPTKYLEEWQKWLSFLPCLENLRVKRCFRPQHFGEIKNAQLHLFSDGSELGYGACAYLRLVDTHNRISCSLVIGKSRLAPIKQKSIPRLELSGAVIACRLYELLSDELETEIHQVSFWTDSMIVLGYIKNETKRFKTFVGNRVSVIHDITSSHQWRHVDSSSNPADIASRGVEADDTTNLSTWLNGPDFLWQDESHWPQVVPQTDLLVNKEDMEIKKDICVNTVSSSNCIDDLLCYYSDWGKLTRAVAWIQRYKLYCRKRYIHHHAQCNDGELSITEVRSAVHAILVQVQGVCFPTEIKYLKNAKPVRKDSHIATLNPVLDDKLIRAKGRLISKDTDRYPIILPGNHHVTTLIIRHYHMTNGHMGTQQVLAATREKYWIIHGPRSVKKVIGDCFVCRRQHSPLLKQQMAPLLDEQMTADKPPFTFVGIDYFGPLIVKAGRVHAKRYGCLFTCLTTRAIHLEVSHSLTTDSFIASFQRFTARRGKPEKVYSDNGTNLVSGDKQMRKSIQVWNQSKISQHMTQFEIEWKFNPPYASHRGGAWERLIRSTRTILRALTRQQLLNDEQLLTFMAEAEKIMNDRPITPVSNDPNDPPALTPNMLLLMKSNSSIPPGLFTKADVFAKRWWKQVQYLSNVFWRRWTREYIPMLQTRQKWQRSNRDLRVDDVVLVAEDNTPRGLWPLGRVIRINVGRDGHVRSCVVKSRTSESVKPITKLCLLECSN